MIVDSHADILEPMDKALSRTSGVPPDRNERQASLPAKIFMPHSVSDSILSAPKDAPRHVLLVDAQAPMQDIQVLDVPLGLLRVNAGIRSLCPDIETRILNWNTFARLDREQALVSILQDFRPAIVGLSAFSYRMPWAKRIAAIVRDFDPRIPVVLGGHHATVHPEGLAEQPLFDWYVVGEGHRSGPELFRSLLDGTPGPEAVPSVAWRQGGRVHRTAPLPPASCMDDVPAIEWSDLELGSYKKRNFSQTGGFVYRFDRGELLPYVATQGCPYFCRFCERVGGRRARFHGPQRVVDDLSRMLDTFGGRHVFFLDNYIHLRRSWFLSLLDALEKRLDLDALCLVMADRLDREVIDRMLAAGLRYLACFPESASARVRGLMDKPIRLDAMMENMRYASEQGAVVSGSFLLGWPGETSEEARETLRLASDPLFDVVMFNQLIYFHGSEIGQHLTDMGIGPNSDAYYNHLLNPGELCLADYPVSEYADYYQAGRDLNAAKLESPGVVAKLARMGMRMEYVRSQVSPDADRPYRDRPSPRGMLTDRLGADLSTIGLAVGNTRVSMMDDDGPILVLQVTGEDGRKGEFRVRTRDESSAALLRAGPYDFWYEQAGTLGDEQLAAVIKQFASLATPEELESPSTDMEAPPDGTNSPGQAIVGKLSDRLGADLTGDGVVLGRIRLCLARVDQDEVRLRLDWPGGGWMEAGIRERLDGSPAFLRTLRYDLWYGERKDMSDHEVTAALQAIGAMLESG